MYCGYITTLKGLRKHSNADRLQCVEVFGQNVIVDLSYKDGQRVVFFPSDGQLSEEYANDNKLVRVKDENGNNVGGYMDPNKRNVTAIRLRGEKSEGLILPIDTLSKYTDINKLKDGDQITVLGGHEICKKYIPRGNKRSNINSNKKKEKYKENISYPFFEEHKEYKIIHSHMSELGYFALREATRQEIPVRICHAHNAPHGFEWKMIVRNYFKKRMMPYLTHMFMCGKESGDWLFGKENEDKFIQLNNAIDAERFRYDSKKEEAIRKELNLENKFVVGHVGRFFKQKNHQFLIEIFNEIQTKKENAILLLVGTGELKEEIQNQVKELGLEEQVRFLGVRSDVDQIMKCFDVFLFPSLFEGLPVTMVEAQAAGDLCIISDTIPRECCITENVRIYSLEKDAKAWSDFVISESTDYKKKDMYEEIVKAGFDIKQNAKWLEEFYVNAAKS